MEPASKWRNAPYWHPSITSFTPFLSLTSILPSKNIDGVSFCTLCIMWYVLFCIWLLTFSIMFEIHPSFCIEVYCSFLSLNSIPWCKSNAIYSPFTVCWTFGLFLLFIIMNKAVMNILYMVFCWTYISISPGCIPRNGIGYVIGYACVQFIWWCPMVFQNDAIIYTPKSILVLLHILANSWCCLSVEF